MKRAAAWLVLGLVLLLLVAFFLRREPREETPRRAPSPPAPVAEAAAPLPRIAADSPAPPAAPAAPVAAGPRGTVRGLVKIQGWIPARKPIDFGYADPKCAAIHAGAKILMDDLVVDANGNAQWAFVHVKSGPIGTPPPAPSTPVLMDQLNCMFTPHMVGVRVGQPLRVLSSDRLLHNVHALPFKNREFNVGLPQAGMEVVRTFDVPEVMVVIKCDIHPWMKSWIGVLDHPHFSITNEIGSYMLPDLPPGKYVVETWHEKCNPVSLSVDVPPGGDVRLDFVLDLKKQ